MARQCLLATIMHQPETRSPASTDRSLLQSRTPVSLVDETAKGAKYEDLEKAVVGNDLEKFFSSWSPAISSREERTDRVSQEEY